MTSKSDDAKAKITISTISPEDAKKKASEFSRDTGYQPTQKSILHHRPHIRSAEVL